MDTKKLRQKILDLAIRGKLVPQDPNDEPASVLLERIRAEKEQLIKEGKIKRSKKSAATDKSHYENMPFEIPESWCWCTLSELCIFLSRGKSPKYSDERLFPVFAQKCNLKDGGISLDQARFLDPSTIGKWGDDYKLKSGDVLVNSTGTGTVGRTRLFDECCLGEYPFVVPDSHISVARTVAEIDSFYIWAILSSNWGQQYLEDNLAGSTNQKELYIGVLENMLIPLPPKNEQKKIAKEIARWEKYVDNIDVVKEKLSNYIKQTKSKILDLAISGKLVPQDPNDEPAIELLKRINPDFQPCDNSHYENIEFDIPQNWVWATIGDIFEHNTGKALNASNPNGTMLDYITTSNLYWDRFELSIIKQMPFTESEIERCIVRKGDLLICEGGDVGRAAIWDYDYNIMIQNHIHRLRGKVDICTRYFFYLFMHYKLHNLIGGKGVAIQGLSSRDLHNLIIPVPSLKEQYDIASSIDLYFSKLDMITAEL